MSLGGGLRKHRVDVVYECVGLVTSLQRNKPVYQPVTGTHFDGIWWGHLGMEALSWVIHLGGFW